MFSFNYRRQVRYGITAAILLLSPALVFAEIDFELAGFGTLGAAVLDSEHAEYRSNLAQDGADNKGTLELDSRLGLQADIAISSRVNGTLQLLAQEGYEGDPRVEVEWALANIELSESWNLRLGRMVLPVFNLSDHRYVSYSLTQMRPPEDLYSQIPFGSFDGIDLNGNFDFFDGLLDAQLYTGVSDEKGFDGFRIKADESLGINLSFERDFFRIRAGYLFSRIAGSSATLQMLVDGLNQALPVAPQVEPLLDQLSPESTRLNLFSLGLNLDFGKVFIDAEYIHRDVSNWIPNVNAWSFLIGLQHGPFTPYVFTSASRETEGDRTLELPEAPVFQVLQQSVNLFLAPRDQTTIGVGTRWSIAPNIALKAQIERISREDLGLSFIRTSVDDGLDEGEDVTLFGLAVDFVF